MPGGQPMAAGTGPAQAAMTPGSAMAEPTGPRPDPGAVIGRAPRRLRALILPPMAWGPRWAAHVPGETPDPHTIYQVLRQHGIDTTLIDPAPRPWNPFAGRNTLLEALDPWRALRVLVRERRADLVVSVFEGGSLPLLLLRRLLGFRVPVVLWDIGLTESWRLRERVLGLVVPRIDAIMVLGSAQAPYIRRRWRADVPIEVIHHHIDAGFWHPGPADPDGPVLSIGEDPGRDYPLLNRAAQGLGAPVVVKTRRGAAAFGGTLAPEIALLDQWMSFTELRALYARARVVVVPLRETLNCSGVSSVLEAMAMGRPLVVSESAAIRDYIVPDETCLAVPCGDADALRAAIRRLLDDPALAARLAAKGRAMVEARFANPVFAAALAGTLRRLAETHARGR
jgi:glycosyltransferase involved in cell wall biosynthesis